MTTEDNKKESKKKGNFSDKSTVYLEKIRKNPWMLASIVLVLMLLVLVMGNIGNSCVTGNVVSENQISEKMDSFVQSQIPEGDEAEITDVVEENGIYKVSVSYQGQNIPLYATLDGEFLVQGVTPLEAIQEENTQTTNQQTQQPSSFSESDLNEISEFMTCLEKENVNVYGANWCGYTQQLVDNLGGQEVIEPIYVECTEEEQLCAEEEVTGYPTIKINGEKVNIERTLQGFADATSCELPVLEGTTEESSSEVTC